MKRLWTLFIIFALISLCTSSRDIEISNQFMPSKIIEFDDSNAKISNSVLLGVTTTGNSNILIENCTVYRIVTYDNSKIILRNSNVIYINDRDSELETILNDVIEPTMTDEEKVLSIRKWVNDTIKHDKCPTYNLGIQNYNASRVLQYMDGDCGAHSAVFTALVHQAGFPSRIVELWHTYDNGSLSGKLHVVSEIYLNDKWIMLDPDPGSPIPQQTFYDSNGEIQNSREIGGSLSPYRGWFKNIEIKYITQSVDGWMTGLPSNPLAAINLIGYRVFDLNNRIVPLYVNSHGEFYSDFYENGWIYLKGRTYEDEVITKEISMKNTDIQKALASLYP